VLSENYPVPMRRVGVKDKFGESGNPDELLEHFDLTYRSIIDAVKSVKKMVE